MLMCPKCDAKYKKSILKKVTHCVDCNEELKDIVEFDDIVVNNYTAALGDPEKWAKSTLVGKYEFDELREVYSIMKNKKMGVYPRERCWLHDVLDEQGIPYKIDILSLPREVVQRNFKRKLNFKDEQHIYVLPEHEQTVKDIIAKCNSKANLSLPEEYKTGAKEFDPDAALVQVKCPSCGEECDFDYPKCPACKKPLY